MQMAGMELLLAVQHRLPVVFAVFNDGRYNMVHHGYRLLFDRLEPFATPPIDFAAWATAIGVRARKITRPGEITAALLDELTTGDGPAVLDIRQDADVRIRGDGRIEAIRQMSLSEARAGASRKTRTP
jgi:thiamine pyrophosphate-dependent acetolactate synthase large subunit-like protein